MHMLAFTCMATPHNATRPPRRMLVERLAPPPTGLPSRRSFGQSPAAAIERLTLRVEALEKRLDSMETAQQRPRAHRIAQQVHSSPAQAPVLVEPAVWSGNESVCVAIPCAPKHWSLLPRVLRSVQRQTRRPERVVVALSHTQPAACEVRQGELTKMLPGAGLKCVGGSGWTRGHNRNVAADACGNVTLIAYVDADDQMAPVRLERMVALMSAHQAHLGLHAYNDVSGKRANDPGSDMTAAPAPASKVRSPEQVAVVARSTQPQHERALRKGQVVPLPIKTHHGHVVVRASVMKTVPQPEDLRIGEDSSFVRNVIAAGFRAVHTEEELTAYSHGSSVVDEPGKRRSASSGGGGVPRGRLTTSRRFSSTATSRGRPGRQQPSQPQPQQKSGVMGWLGRRV